MTARIVLQDQRVTRTAHFTAPFLDEARNAVEEFCTEEHTRQFWIRSLFGLVHRQFLRLKLRYRFEDRDQPLLHVVVKGKFYHLRGHDRQKYPKPLVPNTNTA